MKTRSLFPILVFIGLAAIGCKKDKNDPAPVTGPEWKSGVTVSDIMTELKTKAPAVNNFTMNGAAGGTVTSDSISVMIPANAFADQNGNAYSGTVSLKMQTLRNTLHMLYSGVTTTSDGELLISDGMFRLEAYDNSGNPLQLRSGATFSAEFPRANANSVVFKGVPRADSGNSVEWATWDSTSVKRNAMGSQVSVLGLDSLFTWCNLDRFMNETPLTDITVKVPDGFTNSNCDCFMRYTGTNAAAYIPSNVSLKAFSTKGKHYQVVQGRETKLICFSKKDNNYYLQEKTFIIGSDQTIMMDSMQTMSVNALETALQNGFGQ